eukprot:scaffold31072_cov60-Phaeocystis_antarctica.AAC.4
MQSTRGGRMPTGSRLAMLVVSCLALLFITSFTANCHIHALCFPFTYPNPLSVTPQPPLDTVCLSPCAAVRCLRRHQGHDARDEADEGAGRAKHGGKPRGVHLDHARAQLEVAAARRLVDGPHRRQPTDAAEFGVHVTQLGTLDDLIHGLGRDERGAQVLREEAADHLREDLAQSLRWRARESVRRDLGESVALLDARLREGGQHLVERVSVGVEQLVERGRVGEGDVHALAYRGGVHLPSLRPRLAHPLLRELVPRQLEGLERRLEESGHDGDVGRVQRLGTRRVEPVAHGQVDLTAGLGQRDGVDARQALGEHVARLALGKGLGVERGRH